MCCTSKFTSYVTMISNFFFMIINNDEVFFYKSNNCYFVEINVLFFFSLMIKFLLKCLFITFFAIFILLKNCFNKFISCIFTPINNNLPSKPIINTNNFISKTTRNVVLIFFCVRTFRTFNIP